MVDKKRSCADFVNLVHPDVACKTCFFEGMVDVVEGAGRCYLHQKSCPVPSACPAADFVTVGLPCQPYSNMRSNRKAVKAHQHKDFKAMTDFLECAKLRKPHGGVIEEVMGFCSELESGTFDGDELPKSWAAWLSLKLKELGYWVQALKLDNSDWSVFPRPRPAARDCEHVRQTSRI